MAIRNGREVIPIPTCQDCKFYKPVDANSGDCFGHKVPAGMAAEKCPVKGFIAK